MAYILAVQRYDGRWDVGWDTAAPTRWLVCDEDGDAELPKPDSVLGIFGSLEDAERWLKKEAR